MKIILLVIVLLPAMDAIAQNCIVNFPGTSNLLFSSECGGGASNLVLGSTTYLGDSDSFTFDSPSSIDIDGNVEIFIEGDGLIIIPAGVTVTVDGNFDFIPKGNCETGTCNFEIRVDGILSSDGNITNDVDGVTWSGTGSVYADGNFGNTSNGCMSCGPTTCPAFPSGGGNCYDNGTSCTSNFCTDGNYGNDNPINPGDTEDPVITNCPTDIVINTTSSTCDNTASWTPPDATDNVSVSSFTSNYDPGDTFPQGTTTVTYTATDPSGNTATCNFNITVNDVTPPTISFCPDDIIVNISGAGCNETVNWVPPITSDNCGISSFTSTHNQGSSFPIGTTLVTYTATDLSGNSTTCSFNVTVNDVIAPVINNCPSDIIVNLSETGCDESVSWSVPSASDNCSIASFTSTHNPGDVFSLGTTTVTYTALDASGNTSNCSFNIVVNDTSKPVFENCPSDITMSNCNPIVSWIPPNAIDNCSLSSLTSNYNPGNSFPLGSTEVTYTAVDNNGNVSFCNFFVTIVEDSELPVLTNCSTDIDVSTQNDICGAQVNWEIPQASDNCSISSFTSNYQPGDTFPLGTTTVIYLATDDSGNITSCSFNITVRDDIAPQFQDCPQDITFSLSENLCEIQVNWIEPSVIEKCSAVSMSSTHSPGDFFQIGATPVTYTARDSNGNESTCTFNIIVEDNYLPAFEFCPTSIIVSAFNIDDQNAEVNWDPPVASDNCGEVNLTSLYNPGDLFRRGSTEVLYTATDSYGNAATCSFTVNIVGNSYPESETQSFNAYSGESTIFCLTISDPDGDDTFINNVISVRNNSMVEIQDRNCFSIQSEDNFEGQEYIVFEICDEGEPIGCIEVEAIIDLEYNLNLTVYKAITPNGDNQNDIWIIENIDNYPDNQVRIFDRWGGLVFTASGYNNENVVWDGSSNQGSNSRLPSGTYFYKIAPNKDSQVLQGFIELVY